MIDKNKFYDKNDYPGNTKQKIMWHNIRNSISGNFANRRTLIDLRSFMFGMAFTIIIFVISIAAVKFVPQLFLNYKNEEVKINNAYSSASDELEKSLPHFISTLDKSERTKQLLNVRMEELHYINETIKQYKYSINQTDLSIIKQQRLLELYQLKIDAINKIIQLKGESWL